MEALTTGQAHTSAARWLGLGLVGVLALFVSVLGGEQVASYVVVLLFFAIGAYILRRSGNDFFNPYTAFPAAYCFWFALGCVNMLNVEDPMSDLMAPIPLWIWAYIGAGIVAYFVATRWAYPNESEAQQHVFDPREVTGKWDRDKLKLVFAVLLFLGVAAWLAIVVQEGIPLFSGNVSEDRVLVGQRHGILFQVFISAFWSLLPMAYLHLWTDARPSRWLRFLTHGFAAVSAFLLISMGSRGYAVIPAVVILIIRNYTVRRWKVRHIVIVAVIAYVLISVAGYWRDFTLFGPAYPAKLLTWGIPLPIQPLMHGYFYVRAPIVTWREIAKIIPESESYQFGGILLSPLLSILPGHHESSDLLFKRLLKHDFIGFGEPASLLGSFYADGGMFAVILGMLGTAALHAWLYRRMRMKRTLLSILMFCYYCQVLYTSLFGSIFPYIMTIWLPVMWWGLNRFLLKEVQEDEPQ